jgi:hypothetical protein
MLLSPTINEPAQLRMRLISPRVKASPSQGACQSTAVWNGYSWFLAASAPAAGFSGTSESSRLICSTIVPVKSLAS